MIRFALQSERLGPLLPSAREMVRKIHSKLSLQPAESKSGRSNLGVCPAFGCSPLRQSPARDRPRDGSAPDTLAGAAKRPSHALPILGVGYRGPHRRSRDASDTAPSGDISDIDRLTSGDRNAGWGSDRSRPRRFRLCQWTTHYSERKVRQVSRIAATSEYRGRTG